MRLLLSLLLLPFAATAAQAQNPERQGRALVQEFCAPCHAVGPDGKSTHPDAPPFSALGKKFDLDEFPHLLERGISSAHPDMPQFKFTQEHARAVRDYVRTIQK